MREAGFALVNCGENGPAAWKDCDEWNRRWDEFRKSGELARWPIGSVGAAFAAFRQTGVWHAKKPRTKEDWERGWKYIEEPFGDIEPQMIVLAQIDNWYRSIVVGKGVREGWRAMKIWRALWGAMVALGYCHKQDPSKAIRRETPTYALCNLAGGGSCEVDERRLAEGLSRPGLPYCRRLGSRVVAGRCQVAYLRTNER
jgi:hypothetical protein